jgi:single-stranded-DNA-specific exonuclease
MQIPSNHWLVNPKKNPEADLELAAYDPVLRNLLINRGYQTREAAQQYLQGLPPEGTEPANMLGISEACDRILQAIRRQEMIAVYGDYDVDGVTATALLSQSLQSLGANVQGYIPNRFEEGYGLNNEALDTLESAGVKLVITVDCGIRSLAEADHARRLGLDLIITDHHHPGQELPEALVILNPKQASDPYPDKNLAGVGLAYKLALAMHSAAGSEGIGPVNQKAEYLDLVALGTVADVAPLIGENRSLVKLGLEQIHHPQRQGLLSLIGAAGLKAERITAENIGFALGPRLNAAGRLSSALAALNLLTTSDLFEAGRLAQQLDIQNQERQKIMHQIQEDAEKLSLSRDPDGLILFAVDPSYNSGVVGLAASRLSNKFYRPAIVGCQGEQTTRGSCRSIPEFHITAALDQCADLLERYGGHAAAAGFTVRNENLPALIERLQAIADNQLSSLRLRPTRVADLELKLSELKPDLLELLDLLQPTGEGNASATFVSRDLKVANARTVGKDGAHLKFSVTDGTIYYDAIAFRQGHLFDQLPSRLDLMYKFEVNEFNGRTTLQLNVIDLKQAGAPDE